MKSARIERADGTERSYLFFRGAGADGCRIREAEMRLSSNAGVNPILDRLIIDIAEAISD